MATGGIILAQSQNLTGSSALPQVTFPVNSRATLVISASAYPGGTNLQLQVQGPAGNWIQVGSGGFNVDQLFAFDAPGGQYRLVCNASSAIGLNAVLCNILY